MKVVKKCEFCNSKPTKTKHNRFCSRECYKKSMIGHSVTDEIKEKIKITLTGFKHSEETKNKLRGNIPWNKGKTNIYSKEVRKRMSKAHLGEVHSAESIRKNRETSTGRWHTEETKKKLSIAHMGKIISKETKKK